MKKTFIVLLLMSGFASAADYWTTPTQAGGRIVLTLEKADYCGNSLYVAYVEKTNQDVVYGCWSAINGKIHVRYNDGNRKVYEPDLWTKHESN